MKEGVLFIFGHARWRIFYAYSFAKPLASAALLEDQTRRAKKLTDLNRGHTGGKAPGRSGIANLHQQRQQIRSRSLFDEGQAA